MPKRKVDVVVISDVHLGTYACKAQELVQYLQSIETRLLILNGDIFDGWQFSKHYFPPSHAFVIQQILNFISRETEVIYVTGNHDEVLRKYADLCLGNFKLADKALLEIDGKTHWIFHGDVFDHTTSTQAKLMARLGSHGYAFLLLANKCINSISKFLGREKVSFAKSVMHQINKRIIKIEAFENLIADIAIEKRFATVICGHIHQPKIREISTEAGVVTYLNSGDWVEHMTALEYYDNKWNMYTHAERVESIKPKEILRLKPTEEEFQYHIPAAGDGMPAIKLRL